MESTFEDSNLGLAALFSDLVRLETGLWDAIDGRLRDDCGLRGCGAAGLRTPLPPPEDRLLVNHRDDAGGRAPARNGSRGGGAQAATPARIRGARTDGADSIDHDLRRTTQR